MLWKLTRLFYKYRLMFLLFWETRKGVELSFYDRAMFTISNMPETLLIHYKPPKELHKRVYIRTGFRNPAHYVSVGDSLCEHIRNGEYITDKALLDHITQVSVVSLDAWLSTTHTDHTLSDVATYIFTVMESMQKALAKQRENKELYPYYERRIKGFLAETDHVLKTLQYVAYDYE